MNGEQIAGIVRAIVAAVGGYLVGKGLADAETVAAVAGAAPVKGTWRMSALPIRRKMRSADR